MRAVDNISPSRGKMGIGWRTIVGVMLIGFKTEGINLPSFIMVPREPFPGLVSFPILRLRESCRLPVS